MTVRNQIQETIANIKQLQSVQKHHQSISEQLQEAYNELNTLEDQLVKELNDIEKLEKMSVKSMFYKVLGSQEEQLEKERQEYLQVSLKHKDLKKSIEILEYEYKIISSKVQEIAGHETKLEALKQRRMQEILTSDNQLRLRITGIHSEIDKSRAYIEELRQAYVAGEQCLRSIGLVLRHLKDAESWGQWDMTSQGTYHASMKHNAMDRAIAAAQQAKHQLRIFDKELVDVNIEQTQFNINIEGFSRFMDIFFDNLISDWVIQRKIKNAINNVEAVHDKIQRYHVLIEKEMTAYQSSIDQMEADIDEILVA